MRTTKHKNTFVILNNHRMVMLYFALQKFINFLQDFVRNSLRVNKILVVGLNFSLKITDGIVEYGR